VNSWIFAAPRLGFELRVAAPKAFQPDPEVLRRSGAKVVLTEDINAAAAGADLLYTDVWVSMGKESESTERIQQMSGYQINARLVGLAKPGALVMHCLPAYRGKEIDEETFEGHAETIFDQAENRLHVQKSILSWLVADR
jgi:ornithine carbamoyltransferase